MSPVFRTLVLVAFAWLWTAVAVGGPLPRESVPDPLKPWVPWVLHDEANATCPPAWNTVETRECLWPSRLEVEIQPGGAHFFLALEAFSALTAIPLPGDAEHWPQDVMLDGKPAAVVAANGTPILQAPPGRHTVEGRFLWPELPPSLKVSKTVALIRVKDGANWLVRQPDASGQLWLRADDAGGNQQEALTLRTFRRIEDGQALRVFSRFELTFAGKPREVTLPHALLAGFTPLSLTSPLPARLGADGALRLQARAGEYVIEVEGRRLDRLTELTLPKDAANAEIWSWAAHRELRVVDVQGTTVDPKQSGAPQAWQTLPAFLLRPGERLLFEEQRRGDPNPAPDRLSLARTLWLDGDGGGFTIQDRIAGTVSRAWRLESRAPLALGHVASDGVDQYITRLDPTASPGFELRHGVANIVADSRVEHSLRRLPAGGWNTEFQQATTELRLPPGWMLLHAGGVDRAAGAWVSAWTLWDVFALLLISLAAWKTCGRATAAVLGVALLLTWQVSGAPTGLLWLIALGIAAVVLALPNTRFARILNIIKGLIAVIIVAQLLAFGVGQIRSALYPALEEASASMAGGIEPPTMNEVAAPVADAPEDNAMVQEQAAGNVLPQKAAPKLAKEEAYRARKAAPGSLSSLSSVNARYAVDAGTPVQTGPGLPQWSWRSHTLTLQGPVAADQEIRLWLLPPFAHAVVRVLSVLLLALAFALVFLRERRLAWPGRQAAPALVLGLAVALGGLAPSDVRAESAPPQAAAPVADSPVFQHWLDALREKLLAAPDCMPECAQVPRLMLEADGERAILRLEAHAAADASLPLPGQVGQLKVVSVLLDEQPASLRRDDDGRLWVSLTRGVHQVVMEASVADTAAVNISLPLVPHRLDAKLTGWTLSGVDARGIPQGALTLTRALAGGKAASETTRDALPPLVQVERTLHFADRWTAETTIRRIAPSQAPVEVTVSLLPGEQITDAAIRQTGNQATLTLGSESEAHFTSALGFVPRLVLKAETQPNQIALWRLDADTRWHVRHSGLAPVLHQQGQVWLPQWQPWPGETVTLEISRPQGVPGAGLTLDSLWLQAQPGRRVSDFSARLVLRASLGGTHRVMLPQDAQLQSVQIDGVVQTARMEGRLLNLPIRPGSQQIDIVWREAAGVRLVQSSTGFDAKLPGVNATTRLVLAPDRWILLAGGPRQGPAVLFWSTMVVMLVCALALARSRMTPLGWGGWLLLGAGVAQATLTGAALVAGWFLLLAMRERLGEQLSRWRFNLLQIAIVIASLTVVGVLFDAVRSGLLGSPDMLIAGNGSAERTLIWYQDRFKNLAPSGWALSVPLWVYRALMLGWALWLAASILKWVRWAWVRFGQGGYWRGKPRPPQAS